MLAAFKTMSRWCSELLENRTIHVSLAVLSVLCYYNSLQCGFVFDDISAIRDNNDLRPSTPFRNIFFNDFWGTPLRKEHSHKSYRPLTVLTFRANYSLHGLDTIGWHAVNVVLHLVVCLLWHRVCRLLLHQCSATDDAPEERTNSEASTCANIAAVLFAVHPVHTEAVTGVVGRAELLSSIFSLEAFVCYAKTCEQTQKRQSGWHLLLICFSCCLLASMLSKEQGISIAGICAIYEIFVVQRIHPSQFWHWICSLFDQSVQSKTKSIFLRSSNLTCVRRLVFLCSFTVLLLAGRIYVMGSRLPVFTRFDNPASVAATPVKQLTYSYLAYLNFWLLLFPSTLCCDWTMGTVPLIEGFGDIRNVCTIIVFLVLSAIVRHAFVTSDPTRSRTLIMCLSWLVVPFLPASNLFFPVGFVVAERVLYMPSMGFCLLVTFGYAQLKRWSNGKRWLSTIQSLILGALIASHVLKTHMRNYDWRDEYTLFMSALHVNSRNAKLYNNVGHALESEKRYSEALLYFKQAVAIQEDDIGAHINVGRTYNNLKMYSHAEKSYRRAKALFPRTKPGVTYNARVAPNHLSVFINLAGLIAKNESRLEEADMLYREAISMRADYVQAYVNRGDVLMKLNRTMQAQAVYEKALSYDSDNADIYYNLGVVSLEQGKNSEALAYFNKAIELYPKHEQALLNSAILLQQSGDKGARQMSRSRLERILEVDEDNEKAYFNLGMLATDEQLVEEAAHFFKRAIQLKPDFRSALFNLALLLADGKQPTDAIPYLYQLVHYYPSHVKGLILLGDIYINNLKNLTAAETCYRRILEFDPRNIQGIHNLCVVYVERKMLTKAAACLEYVRALAPTEEYINRHLEIVKERLKKISRLPETSAERRIALTEFSANEFKWQGQEDFVIENDVE